MATIPNPSIQSGRLTKLESKVLDLLQAKIDYFCQQKAKQQHHTREQWKLDNIWYRKARWLVQTLQHARADLYHVWTADSIRGIKRPVLMSLDVVRISDKAPYHELLTIDNFEQLSLEFLGTSSQYTAEILLCQPLTSFPEGRCEITDPDILNSDLDVDSGEVYDKRTVADSCRSALTAALVVCGEHFKYSDAEICDLVITAVGGFGDPRSLIDKDMPRSESWAPLAAARKLGDGYTDFLNDPRSAVMVTSYPRNPFPAMTPMMKADPYELHKFSPKRTHALAVWASHIAPGKSQWRMIVTARNKASLVEFRRFLRLCSSPVSQDAPPALPDLHQTGSTTQAGPPFLTIFDHWIHVLGGLFRPEIQYANWDMKKTLSSLKSMQHQFAGRPRARDANLALMIQHDLAKSFSRTKCLKNDLLNVPLAWGLDLPTPTWKDAAQKECEILLEQINEAQDQAARLRQMVLEQLTLKQNQFGKILSVAAAIYVPLSFATGIFGMNLDEINGSPVGLPYFFYVAIPLVFVTVVLPIFALNAWKWIVRVVSNYSRPIIGTIYILNLLYFSLVSVYIHLDQIDTTFPAWTIISFLFQFISTSLVSRLFISIEATKLDRRWVSYVLVTICIVSPLCVVPGLMLRFIPLFFIHFFLYVLYAICNWIIIPLISSHGRSQTSQRIRSASPQTFDLGSDDALD